MPKFPLPIERLIEQLGHQLPGVGPKTAERYAFALLKKRPDEREQLARAIADIGDALTTCSTCGNYTEVNPCRICADSSRDTTTVCLVATEQDLLAVERTGDFSGLYHVLGGVLSPADGITPNELNIKQLFNRLEQQSIKEIILAFDHTIEGESTMMYLTRILKRFPVKITRLARGLPIGSELNYADEVTLSDALRGRNEINREPPNQKTDSANEQIKEKMSF